MCENFPQYKEEYKKSVKTINFNINWINNEVSDTNLFFKISSSDEEKIQSKKDELKRSVPDLERHRSKYIIWCSIASAAAAGFICWPLPISARISLITRFWASVSGKGRCWL